MPEQEGTTTVEVKYDTWAALDRRKERGDSFDDVIRKLINASAVGVGEMNVGDQGIEASDVEKLSTEQLDGLDEGCDHGDSITGEICGDDVEYRQRYRYNGEDEWSEFYYCEQHAPASEE